VRRESFESFEPPRFGRTDRELQWGPLLAAAAVGFLAAILFGPCQSTHPQQGEEDLVNLQSELQGARDRVAELESQLSAAREGGGKASEPGPSAKAAAPEPRAKADAAERGASEREQKTAPAPKPEHRSELTPEEVLRKEPMANPEPAKESAKEAEPPEPTPPAAIANPPPEPPPEPSRTAPDQFALADPQQVAAASVYDSPESAGPVVRATARSDTPGMAALQALTPERAGWTMAAQPTLYWHASEATRFPCEFKLIREGTDEPLVRVQLPAPAAAGIQRIELSQFGISLDEGTSYRWSVTLVDLEGSGADRATGGIRRVAPPESLRTTADGASASEHLDALERAGLWYDALDLVTRMIERNPRAENLVARRNAMLAKARIQLS
jgi:hypothetical protein